MRLMGQQEQGNIKGKGIKRDKVVAGFLNNKDELKVD